MIVVLMPAYNEEDAVARLLPRMPRRVNGHAVETIVLSDGSTDATVDVARGHGCATIAHPSNRGKGAILQSGFEAIRGTEFDALVLMDADGQHDPSCLADLTRPVLEGTAHLVIGSRYIQTPGREDTPWNRYVVRCATNFLLRLILPFRITDPYSGYRAMTPHAMGSIELRGDRYESELEMLFCAKMHGLRVEEIPIRKVYGPETSKMGSRYGSFLGRVDVVARHAWTIARGVLGSCVEPARATKEAVTS